MAALWAEAGLLGSAAFVAADLGARLLPRFVANVEQPRSSDPVEVAQFVTDWFEWWKDAEGDRPRLGYCDTGGNNTAAQAVVLRRPGVWASIEESGASMVNAYCLTPRVADLALPVSFEAARHRPAAVMLVLNTAKGERGLASFDELRGQEGYRAMLKRGAVEIVLPRLDERVAQEVEGSFLPFGMAAAGRAPKGARALDEVDATVVGEWLADLRAALGPAMKKGWLA